MDQSTPEVWKKQHIQDLLHVSKSTVNAWVATGYIPHVRLGRVIRFLPEQIREWMRDHTAGTDTTN